MAYMKRSNISKDLPAPFSTEYHETYNTFNKAKFPNLRDKMNNSSKFRNYTQNTAYKTFLKSSSPFNYYNNERNNLQVNFNGGPKREFAPILSKTNLMNRSSSLRYKRPCGCPSKYNISKYSECYEPEYENNLYRNYGTYQYNQRDLPYINTRDNLRYSNDFNRNEYGSSGFYTDRYNNTPQVKNVSGKIKYKLNDYRMNTDNNNEKLENKNNNKNEEDYNNKKNFFKVATRRTFRKTQIFNNYKPFLVDDFRDYGDYE